MGLRLVLTINGCAALWILFVAGTKRDEMIVGAICMFLTVWFISYVAQRECPHVQFRFRDVARGWRIPGYLVTGTWEIFLVLIKDVLHLAPAESLYRSSCFRLNDDSPATTARRVLAISYTTATPNFIVVGIDLETKQMLFHQISKSGVLAMTQRLGAQA
jgi:multisubunit Na+/H+ antiporter MnhE subunit